MKKGHAGSIMGDCLLVAAIIIGIFGLCWVLKPCSCMAAAEWRISPSVTVEGMYDSNYFKSAQNPTSVWGMTITPAVEVQAVTDRSKLDFNYKAPYFMYFGTRGATPGSGAQDLSSQDYLGQDLSLLAMTRVSNRLTTGINETFQLTREPGFSDVLSQIVTRNMYWINRVSPFVSCDIGEKGEIKLAYRNEMLNFLDGTPGTRNDSLENRGIMTMTYNFNSTNHLDLDNEFWRREYPFNPASPMSAYNSYQIQLIYRHDLSSWLQSRVGAGYQWRYFDQTSGLAPNMATPTYLVGLTGDNGHTKVDLSFEHNMVDYTVADSYFTAYRVNAFVQRLFCDGVIRVFGGGYYQLSDYTTSTLQTNEYSLRGGVGYSFWQKRMELSVEYNYTQRLSNLPGFGYNDNVIYMRLTSKWDFPKK